MLWAHWAQLGSCSASRGVGRGCSYLGVQMVRWAGMLKITRVVGHWCGCGKGVQIGWQLKHLSSLPVAPLHVAWASDSMGIVFKRGSITKVQKQKLPLPQGQPQKSQMTTPNAFYWSKQSQGQLFFFCTCLNVTNISLSPIIHGNFLNSVFITNCTNWL